MTRQESTVLLREARQGSREALGELYARYGTRLQAFIRMRLGRDLRARVESRDILQATLLKSFERLAQFEGSDGTALMKTAAWLLFTVSPFAVLEPLAYLSETAEYSRAFDWAYLGLAITMALLSRQRQRKSFYYAGLINTGVALWLITTHYEWFDKPAWAILLIGVGLAGLLAGFGLDWRERRRAVVR